MPSRQTRITACDYDNEGARNARYIRGSVANRHLSLKISQRGHGWGAGRGAFPGMLRRALIFYSGRIHVREPGRFGRCQPPLEYQIISRRPRRDLRPLGAYHSSTTLSGCGSSLECICPGLAHHTIDVGRGEVHKRPRMKTGAKIAARRRTGWCAFIGGLEVSNVLSFFISIAQRKYKGNSVGSIQTCF